jgi:hypothetical protein
MMERAHLIRNHAKTLEFVGAAFISGRAGSSPQLSPLPLGEGRVDIPCRNSKTILRFTIYYLPAKVTFEYGAFTRFDVDTPDASLTPPVKP